MGVYVLQQIEFSNMTQGFTGRGYGDRVLVLQHNMDKDAGKGMWAQELSGEAEYCSESSS